MHNGWGVGETRWGCLAERARLKGDWLVRCPPAFTARQAMAIGTAGYTAMLCVMALEQHGVKPGDGEVLVTGATGGVGSVAMALLARLGYGVVAATGKAAEAYLSALGAAESSTAPSWGRPASRCRRSAGRRRSTPSAATRWPTRCAQTRYGGIVAACGLAQGFDLPATVSSARSTISAAPRPRR